MREERVSPAHRRKRGREEDSTDTCLLTTMAGSIPMIFRAV